MTLYQKIRQVIWLFAVVFLLLFLTLLVPAVYREQQKELREEAVGHLQATFERMDEQMNLIELLAQSVRSNTWLTSEISQAIWEDGFSEYEKYGFKTQTLSILNVFSRVAQIRAVRIHVDSPDIREYPPYLYRMDRAEDSLWYAERNDLPLNGRWYLDVTDGQREEAYSGYFRGDDMASYVLPMKINSSVSAVFEIVLPMTELIPELYDDLPEEDFFLMDSEGVIHGFSTDTLFWKENLKEKIFGLLEREKSEEGRLLDRMLWSGIHPVTLVAKECVGSDMTLGSMVSGDRYMKQLAVEMGGILVASFVISCMILHAVNRIVRRMLTDFAIFRHCVRQVREGDMDTVIPTLRQIEVNEIAVEYNQMLSSVKRLTEEAISREVMVKDAQLRSLEKQIDAHFLYNVLDSIKMMAEVEGNYGIADALLALGAMFRYNLQAGQHEVALKEEIAYLESYLKLCNLRYDYYINLSEKIDPSVRELKVPKMILQPIVENSIIYGLDELAEDTAIYLKAYVKGDTACIELTDMGKGMDEETLAQVREEICNGKRDQNRHGGIGLHNIHKRIQLMYGSGYGVDIYSMKGCYTKVVLTICTLEGKDEQNSYCGR